MRRPVRSEDEQRSHPRPTFENLHVDAGMTLLVPEKKTVLLTSSSFEEWRDVLVSALEFIGAAAGWIGLQGADGRLTFPVHAGAVADSWLDWQQGRSRVWGVAVGGEPAFLNDLRPWPMSGGQSLHNLLSCPLIHNDQILGHVALANKPHGFAATDKAVLQGLAHHMIRLLDRRLSAARAPIDLAPVWRRILDRAEAAVLLLDEFGSLIFANATWLDWTGFRAEELLGQTAPFPFWLHPEDLHKTLPAAPVLPDRALPFRRRDQSVFWCLLETASERWDDRAVTVALLQQTTVPSLAGEDQRDDRRNRAEPQALRPATLDWLPLVLDLDGGIEGWGSRWEERTGLPVRDVEGSRSDLVLDWLFPQQCDRDRVADTLHRCGAAGCQLDLDIAAPRGSRFVRCTFLPWMASASTPAPRRWLLLVGDPIPAATLDRVIPLERSDPLFAPHLYGQRAAAPPSVSPETRR